MSKPDYSSYTIEELIDCKENIDREAWPERFVEIEQRIKSLVKSSPSIRSEHNELVFFNYCESLRDDLTFTMDDNFLSIFGLFSKRAKKTIPSTFQGEVCPICAGELDIDNSFGSWFLACKNCEVQGVVEEIVQH